MRLQHNERKHEITIRVPRKKYVLKAESAESMKEWFDLFEKAMNQQLTLNNLSQHSTANLMDTSTMDSLDDQQPGAAFDAPKRRISEQPLPISIPQDEVVESFGMMPPNMMSMQHRKTCTESNQSALDLSQLTGNQYGRMGTEEHSQTHSKIPTFDHQPARQARQGQRYEFAHGILRDSIYEQMLSNQRIRIHKSIQEYLREVLDAISSLPEYPNKEVDTRQYNTLKQRHAAIEEFYSFQQRNLGAAVAEVGQKKKRKKHKFPSFIGLD